MDGAYDASVNAAELVTWKLKGSQASQFADRLRYRSEKYFGAHRTKPQKTRPG